MIKGGLVSISFRELKPEEIIELLLKAKLDCVEWGGDVHVPHGDLRRARELRRMGADAGISVSSYGSYYKAGESENTGLHFEAVLGSALELGAPVIRVWAGIKASAVATLTYREEVISNLMEISASAEKFKIKVSLEFHGNTLTDTNESAVQLMKEVSHENLSLYWQPPVGKSFEYRLEGLKSVLPYLSHLHVYHWLTNDGKHDRRPLEEGGTEWVEYLKLAETAKGDRCALLEFVRDNSKEAFLKDAATLKKWLLLGK
ncbi:MAG: hypothetical protein A2017_17335 [Lentisphaerae bacterium GWF2_44_16]|nr:MAG: hypothetical protein A2017_17335 [Lentisphaerae bacterium GWF2_44_16]